MRWQNRAHFFAVSAQLMRRILVDFARAHAHLKRGGGERSRSHWTRCCSLPGSTDADLVALDEALTPSWPRLIPRQRRAVELRFFGGLSVGRRRPRVLKVSERNRTEATGELRAPGCTGNCGRVLDDDA